MRWIEWNRRMNDGRMDIQAGQEISSERKMKMKRILRFLCMFHPRRSSAVTCLCRSSSLRTHFMNRIFVAQFSKKVFFLAKITLYRYFFHRLTRKFAVQAHRARRDIDFRQFSRIFLVSRKSFESNESLRVCVRELSELDRWRFRKFARTVVVPLSAAIVVVSSYSRGSFVLLSCAQLLFIWTKWKTTTHSNLAL